MTRGFCRSRWQAPRSFLRVSARLAQQTLRNSTCFRCRQIPSWGSRSGAYPGKRSRCSLSPASSCRNCLTARLRRPASTSWSASPSSETPPHLDDHGRKPCSRWNGWTLTLDELVAAVEQRRARTKALRLLEATRDVRRCIHCNSAVLVKNGHSQGLQRYRCRACLRTFNAASGTPLAHLRHKARFYQQGECLAQGLTVREAAAAMDVAVSTAFRLRHRFLTAVVPHQPLHAAGLLEVDEMYIHESLKGSRHLPRKAHARGNSQASCVPVLLIGALMAKPSQHVQCGPG